MDSHELSRDCVAVLLAGESLTGLEPPGLGVVGGISLLERQVRMALKVGASRVIVVAAALTADLGARLSDDSRVERAATAAQLAERLTGETRAVLHLAPGLLIDSRLVLALLAAGDRPTIVAAHERPAMLAAGGGPAKLTAHDMPAMLPAHDMPVLLAFGDPAPHGAERLDSATHWAGAALLPAALVGRVAAELGDWELSGTLVRAAVEAGAGRLMVESVPTYAPARRRDAPMIWARPLDEAARAAGTDSLLAAAQKGCLDWPARFIHPRLENAMVRLLLPTSVTPNLVTLLTGLLGLAAIWLFATGKPLWALGLVLIVGPLDGVDGKLARTRHEFSKWGDLEHVLDKVLEYGWILALGYWLSQTHGVAAWLAAGGIIVFALSEAASGEFFRRFTGRQLDDWGTFERRFRLVGGRRNTFFWSLLPFAFAGWWWEGFLMLLGYAAVTFAVSHWRLLKALADYGSRVSDEVKANFADTAYDFLPKGKPAAR
jgi:phosphatidylglycerophosphate synthase